MSGFARVLIGGKFEMFSFNNPFKSKRLLSFAVIATFAVALSVPVFSKDASAHFFGWFHPHATHCVLADGFDLDLLRDGWCPLLTSTHIGEYCECSRVPSYPGIA